ncbi:MAG: hypothetical protein V3T05_06655 [Myxococcota bacterium]
MQKDTELSLAVRVDAGTRYGALLEKLAPSGSRDGTLERVSIDQLAAWLKSDRHREAASAVVGNALVRLSPDKSMALILGLHQRLGREGLAKIDPRTQYLMLGETVVDIHHKQLSDKDRIPFSPKIFIEPPSDAVKERLSARLVRLNDAVVLDKPIGSPDDYVSRGEDIIMQMGIVFANDADTAVWQAAFDTEGGNSNVTDRMQEQLVIYLASEGYKAYKSQGEKADVTGGLVNAIQDYRRALAEPVDGAESTKRVLGNIQDKSRPQLHWRPSTKIRLRRLLPIG